MKIVSLKTYTAVSMFIAALAIASCGPKASQHNDDVPSGKVTTPSGDETELPKRPSGFPQDMAANDAAEPGVNATIDNIPELIEKLNLAQYHARGFRGQNLKIAVLDNGFAGLTNSLGKRLPPDTKLVEAAANSTQTTIHGTKLAELVYALASGSSQFDSRRMGPQMILYNTNGYSNLVEAIDRAIADKVDMILYAQVWEYGGNFNGAGFINAQVNRATKAGILWINAAGNFGQSTFVGPINLSSGHDLDLPHVDPSSKMASAVRLQVPNLGASGLPVRLVLAWNDFADSKSYRTPQDLDLILEDDKGREIAASRLIQDGADHGNDTRYSAHAREIVKATLPPGNYRIRVQALTRNFDANSLMRIAVDGPGVKILDNPSVESILIPADNTSVLTIGASDVEYSARSRGSKPELSTISHLRFDDGQEINGTSAASAVATGALAVMQSVMGKANRIKILEYANSGLLGQNLRIVDPEKLIE